MKTNLEYTKKSKTCHYTRKFRGAAHLRYKMLTEIPVVIHNYSIYYYYFTIKQLAEEFKVESKSFEENNEKYITFLILIKKELDKYKTIIYKLKVIDS